MCPEQTLTAFLLYRRIAHGDPAGLVRELKAVLTDTNAASLLIFDDATGCQVELDLRGTLSEARARLTTSTCEQQPARRGRPKLGVVGREITLLPRHWEWLGRQRGGASAELRRLVDAARKQSSGQDAVIAAQDATFKFVNAIAGNLVNSEEVLRALFAGAGNLFEELLSAWPADVSAYVRHLSADAFSEVKQTGSK